MATGATPPHARRENASSAIVPGLGLAVVLSGVLMAGASAAPGWWSSPGTGTQSAVASEQVVTNGGVVTTNYVPNAYAVATQGQLKQFTARAVDELNAALATNGGAGSALSNLTAGWREDYATNHYNAATNVFAPYKPADFQAVNVGQVKYVAGLVYTRLANAGYTGLYPSWLQSNAATDGDAAVLGQLKEAFAFDLGAAPAAVSGLTAVAGPRAC